MADIDVIGLNELLVLLNGAVQDIENEVDGFIHEAGSECQTEAKARARVDTGEMRDKIMVENGHLESTVTAGAAHSVFNEFGTSRMSAQPFMVPGFEIAKNHLIDKLRDL